MAHAYDKVIGRANSLIYLEDQYLWATDVVRCFADALRRNPRLHLIAVIPRYPDQDGRLALPPNLIGRKQALDELRAAGGARVGVYGIENHAGTPIYVHAKVCVVDDVWATVGSDNINLRSWTHDSELSCAVLDDRLDLRRTAEYWIGSIMGHASSPGICGSNCPANTSTAKGTTTRICWTPFARSRPSRTSPESSNGGTTTGNPAPAHRDGCGPTALRGNLSSPGSGPLPCIEPCTTQTRARDRCADRTDSDLGRSAFDRPIASPIPPDRWPRPSRHARRASRNV